MNAEELEAIRERAERGFYVQQHVAETDARALLAEVERLRSWLDARARTALKYKSERDAAQARLDRVRALHQSGTLLTYWGKHRTLPDDTFVCVECTDPDASGAAFYPCPTIEALEGATSERRE